MFCIPTVIRSSSIHGVGVFTLDPVSTGTTIWEFTPGVDWVLTPTELAAFPEPYQARLRHYTYLDASGAYVLCGDNARFMNHSEDPNCDDSGDRTVARRDIAAGEELVCDYASFDAEFRGYRSNGARVAAFAEGSQPA